MKIHLYAFEIKTKQAFSDRVCHINTQDHVVHNPGIPCYAGNALWLLRPHKQLKTNKLKKKQNKTNRDVLFDFWREDIFLKPSSSKQNRQS